MEQVWTNTTIYSYAILRIHVIEGQRSVKEDKMETGYNKTRVGLWGGNDGKVGCIAEHVWENHNLIHWVKTVMLYHGRGLLVNKTLILHIQITLLEEHFNQGEWLEVSGFWTAVMSRPGGRSNPYRPLTSNDASPLSSAWLAVFPDSQRAWMKNISTVFSVLQATENWAGPGNEASAWL